ATREGMTRGFDELISKVDENSSVLLFYSGHGGHFRWNEIEIVDGKEVFKERMVNGEKIIREVDRYFLQPNGMWECETFDEKLEAMFPAELLKDKLNQLNTDSLVFFLDCCHAAGMTQGGGLNIGVKSADEEAEEAAADSTEYNNLEGMAQKVDNERGVSIISSCRAEQKSQILGGDKYSLFTKCLVKALTGQHKKYFEEPFIRISEVSGYLQREVSRIAKEVLNKGQNPYVNLQNADDFALSYVPQAIREEMDVQDVETATVTKPKSTEKKERVISWRDDGADNLILFLHGFSGEASDTFGDIPNMLMEEDDIKGWDLRPLGYSQFVKPELGKEVWAGIYDIERIADELSVSVVFKFKEYSRIAIVAHSLGGLVAQKAILKLKPEHRERISHLIMFGTPSNGIDAQLLEKTWNKKYSEMSSEGEFITSVRSAWTETFQDGTPFKIKVAASTSDEYVHYSSCFTGFDEDDCVLIDGDHLRMVKPQSKDAPCYEMIIKTLTDTEFAKDYLNKEEINIALGKYEEVVQELLPKADSLGEEQLKQLIFGLEGLDRRDEAIEILNKNENAKGNSDLLGIIAGRHKRSYLLENNESDGQAAIEYYKKGLAIAEAAGKQDQIFYLAINLAFTSIVIDNDQAQMKHYAQQALDATKECVDDLWKIATVAEASMYLGDMETAKTNYEKASELAGIRHKISMYTNGYAGYTALMKTDNPEDEFIKFLKAKFLT
ncbi:MAG: caspase family protein, partial [Bacteroidia bacterium]|nr:caspase family protein [Bacteroidia bacterium]